VTSQTEAKKCCGCVDDEEALRLVGEMTKEYHAQGKSLIQILYMAQGIFGSLPLEVQKVVADGTGTPLAHVSGVVSFYSFFTTQPRGKHTIRVCLGTACYVRGGKKIIEKLENSLGIKVGDTTPDKMFTLEVARCIGACGLAPAMMIDDEVYKQVRPEKLDAILAKYKEDAQEGSDGK
jgi:NADH-quinone oxidoreductase subunit E